MKKEKTIKKSDEELGNSQPSVELNETVSETVDEPTVIAEESSNGIPETEEAMVAEVHIEEPKSEITNEEKEADANLPEAEESTEEKTIEGKSPETNDNVAYVNTQLEKLISLRDAHNFVDFWFYVKELNKMIFTLRGLHKEERIKFKDRIGELCEETKKVQDEVKAKVAKTSHLKLDRIQQLLDEALAFGNTHDELEKSFLKIEEAGKFFREGKVTSEDGEESADMSREHKEKAKEIIKSAKDKIFDRKREVREGNFKIVTGRLNAISDSLLSQGRAQKVFDGIKNLRNEMKSMNLDRSQLREIDNVIETLWKKAREKASTGRVVDAKKRISGMEDLRRRKEIFIKTLEQEIKELNSKWSSNVKNDFFKNRVNEWIEEKKAKIEETRKELDSLQEKIKFLNDQMSRT